MRHISLEDSQHEYGITRFERWPHSGRDSAGILLALRKEGPAVVSFQDGTKSRRDAGATKIIVPMHGDFWGI